MNSSNPRILAIIPARKGSKGLPGKNKKFIAGKPLISWTIEAAKKSKYITETWVSTDCPEIAKIANQEGLCINRLRPSELSKDETIIGDVILYELSFFKEIDIICLLQPTSPLRDNEHIDEALSNFLVQKAPALVSVVKTKHSPMWCFELDKENHLIPLFSWDRLNKRRQDLPKTVMLNGAIYLAHRNFFEKNKSFFSNNTTVYEMSYEDSIDIDDFNDFYIAENKLKEK